MTLTRRTRLFAAAIPFALVFLWVVRPVGFRAVLEASPGPVRLLDFQGRLVGERFGSGAMRRKTIEPADLEEPLVRAILAAEDHRFFRHPGIDPLAVARALAADLRRFALVQGGSTLTQQTARLWHPRGRHLWGKALEALDALRLELWLSKREILAAYLTLAPFGNRVQGAREAARIYLGKDLSVCSRGELAWLVAIPSAPTRLNPWRHPERTLARRDRILRRQGALGQIDGATLERGLAERPLLRPVEAAVLAPHFQVFLEGRFPERMKAAEVRTTLDADLQRACEKILAEQVSRLADRHVSGGAVVVLENESGAVRAWVGSPDWGEASAGQVDGVDEPRQPGSSLKPFTYLLALEGPWNAATVLPDVPLSFPAATGPWEPLNYGGRWRGPVRLREALANSLNLPAVYTLQHVGIGRLKALLVELGVTDLTEAEAHYGLGLTLGNAELRLWQLAGAYRALARGGLASPPVFFAGDRAATERRVFSREAAFLIRHILADDRSRSGAFGRGGVLNPGFPVAVKTGTSQNFRDNLTAGFDDRFTVAVWVGNADGSPMRGVSGVTGAAPVFAAVFQELRRRHGSSLDTGDPMFRTHDICPISGLLPGPHCRGRLSERFIPGREPDHACDWHTASGLKLPGIYEAWGKDRERAPGAEAAAFSRARPFFIANPREGGVYRFDHRVGEAGSGLSCLARSDAPGLYIRWILDGTEIGRSAPDEALTLRPSKGPHRLRARDALGRETEEIRFSVE
ncbi:MAG: penicillin-binding protein 1C [Spirochaetes bacterium]|nr:penicillin-binding protein 1C [Spirochaetota bacterium]